MTRYELSERIGVGAMAEIFRGKAVAGGGFEKPVAIKRILPQLSEDRHFVELLIAEANIVSHLHHRNIVQVFDVGQGPDGQFFLVLEYVDGADLRTLQAGLEAEGKRLPIDLGLYIGAEICDALEHAHQAPGPDGQPLRLVHRDVAPSNVLLSRSGEVKLTDFGIAKRAEEATVHGGVRGKFAYISPEQAYSRPVDARSDVYSVGILLFELLLGKRLFSQMADFDALQAVREGKVPRPRSVDPELDPRLEAILLEALAHDPGERFSGAGALGKALRTFRYAMPSTGSDPALELASAVSYYGERGRAHRAKASASGDGMTTSSTFTITPGDSLVRKQSFAAARQVLDALEEEESRMAEDGIMPGDSAELEALLGAEPLVPDAEPEPEDDEDVAEEETRIVLDPFLSSAAAQRRSAPAASARPSAPQPSARPSAAQPVVPLPAPRPSAQRPAVQPVALPPGGEPDILPPPSPPETITGVEPVSVPAVAVAAPEPGTVRGADGVSRPMAGGSSGDSSRRSMHTGAMPAVKGPSRFLRWTLLLILLGAGGLTAAAMLHQGTKDTLLRLGDDLVSRAKALAPDDIIPESAMPAAAPPDAAAPDAAVPDAAVPDALVPDAAPPDASMVDAGGVDARMVDGGMVDAAPPDAAPATKKKNKRRRKRRRRRRSR